MKNTKKKMKVLVCMSGGVDSSVAAALLIEQGYDVTGAYMKQWTDTKDIHGICSWKDDRREALRVAAHLGIPFLTLDFEKEYKKWVVKYLFEEYEAGRTPNPDVMCNLYIKFGVWLEKAKKMGFDYLATGHYAQITKPRKHNSTKTQQHKNEGGVYHLMEAVDKDKDQTYFLHQLNQEKLSHTLFPVGGYTKKQVRALAKKMKLPTAERAESMGICFIGEIPMKDFLQQKIKPKKGNIVTTDGKILGKHEGLPFYTIGQRHLGVNNNQTTDNRPLYVVQKNMKKNELVVGFETESLLYSKESVVENVNWTSGQTPEFPLECTVRLRHRQKQEKVVVTKAPARNASHSDAGGQKHGSLPTGQAGTKTFLIQFFRPQKAVTPGQFAVFYKNGECLGGGVIS